MERARWQVRTHARDLKFQTRCVPQGSRLGGAVPGQAGHEARSVRAKREAFFLIFAEYPFLGICAEELLEELVEELVEE